MKEDIKILENIIVEYNTQVEDYKYFSVPVRLDERDIEALENLLTRYKQLEEENKRLKKVKSDELIINNPWLFEYLNELYIFKGKVKEKIEESRNLKFKDERLDRATVDFVLNKVEELLREE